MCVCAQLVALKPRTKVVVVQHPRERDNAIGTAWMVERCLGAERIVGVDLERDPAFVAALSDPGAPAIVLAPGPSAIDLHERPPAGPVTLIVVDGTWSQARKLLRVNPSLAALPRYAFRPAKPGNYRIRREPEAHCVSTIEAAVAALSALEGRSDLDEVLAVFDAMVDHQIRIAEARSENRQLRAAIARSARRPGPARGVDLDGDLVVVHAEANAWPRGTEHGPFPEIAHLAAERLSTGERFEAFVAPTRPLSPGFAFHTGVPEARVLAGERHDAFRARLSAFLREGDRVVAWGGYLVELLRHAELSPVDLRVAAIRAFGRRTGDVVQVAASLDRTLDAPWATGRTGSRLAASITVARAVRDSVVAGASAGVDLSDGSRV